MEKRTIILISIFVVAIVAVLGVSFVAAYNIGHFGIDFEKFGNSKNLNQTQIQQMKNFTSEIQTAIKNNDYATWKSLMESQLTQENFNSLVANYQKMSQMMNKTGNFTRHMPGNFTGNWTRYMPANCTGNFTGSVKMRNMHGSKLVK